MAKPSRFCGSCERPLRKGKARRAWCPEPDGTMSYRLVCIRCMLRGFVIVPPAPTTIPPLCSACHGAPAAVCVGCFARVSDHAGELAKANVGLAMAKGLQHDPANHLANKGTPEQAPRSIRDVCGHCGAPPGKTCADWNAGLILAKRPLPEGQPS